MLPGIIGTIQATETIKLLLGIGQPLIGRFLVFEALRMRFRELTLRRDPECPVCGDHPTITALIDYEQFCGVAPPTPDAGAASDPDIEPRALRDWMASGTPPVVLDVREPQEWDICHLPGAVLIPLGDLPQRIGELDPQVPVVCQCRSGIRSARAAQFLRLQGFRDVRNLTGGILAWSDEVDPTVPKY